MVNSTKNLIIPKGTLRKKGGVVILDWRIFEKMRKEIEKLKIEIKRQKELEEVKRIIGEGEREHREGKTIKAPSLKEAFKAYKLKK